MERLGESHLCKKMTGAVPSITNIYSLVLTSENLGLPKAKIVCLRSR